VNFLNYKKKFFPASRGLSLRGKLKREERPLPASDKLFDEAADQISGRNIFVNVLCACLVRLNADNYRAHGR